MDNNKDLQRIVEQGKLFLQKCSSLKKKPTLTGFSEECHVDKKTIKKNFGSFENFILAISLEEDTQLLKSENAFTRTLLEAYQKQRNQNNFIIDMLAAKIELLNVPKVIKPVKRTNKKNKELKFQLLTSDWQIGELIQSSDTGGLNTYSFDEFKKRLEKLEKKILTYYDIHSSHSNVKKLMINMLGDLVNGIDIYPTQAYETDLLVPDQLIEGLILWSDMILRLSSEFEEIEMFCVWGNHGRGGKYVPGKVNYDYLFYRFLNLYFKNKVKNVKIYISESPFLIYREGNYYFYLHHGHNIKGYLSLPFYGLDRMARKVSGVFGVPINYVFIGHFHVDADIPVAFGKAFINGNLAGTCGYAIEKLMDASRASQKLLTFDDEEGITGIHELFVDDPPKLIPDERNIFTVIHRDVE